MKVFLVEDSPPVLQRLQKMIEAIPATRVVGEATGVEEAIDGILLSEPDVVVLDLSLANGSGFDVLSTLHPRQPGIAFYMLSNHASEPYRRHAEQLGALGFFDKTTEFERVRDAIAERAREPRSRAVTTH